MQPRLIAISGPAEGRVFPIDGSCFTIGRHPDSDLPLPSLEVSRNHCEVRRDDDGAFSVVDLDSRHGVFVNHRPVRRHRLAHSDLLSVGGSLLLFLLDDSSAERVAGGVAEPQTVRSFVAASTITRRPTEIFYLDPVRVETELPAEDRVARDLHALLQASRELQAAASVDELVQILGDVVLRAVPARRGAVLLSEPGDRDLEMAVRCGDYAPAWRPDPSVVVQVATTRSAALCAADAPEGPGSAASAGSILCIPLLDRGGELLGAVYGEHPSAAGFEERHLELLGAVAGIASLALDHALHLRWLQQENTRLRGHQLEHDLVGESAAMRKLLDLVARVARAESTVLLRGESGTGKELTAQAIHRSSPRAQGPFVAINCATLSETLLESELFGHEKGAFTGAVERKLGKIEVARGGTLFLDEVAELPPTVQAKLLRMLAERQFERVGGTRTLDADVRVVAATHRDLEAAIRDGSFRADLYYRLKVITLELPPLRARRDDIPLLASHFAAVHGRRLGRPRVGIAPEARRCLMAYDWPGNVRELGNAIERALVLGDGDVVGSENLPEEVVDGATRSSSGLTPGDFPPSDFQAALTEYKKKLIQDAYEAAGGDFATAAERLGVHVNSLHRMITRLGIRERLDG